MNIILKDNETYEIIKNESKIKNKLEDAKYVVVDISTPLKGPVHTIVKPKHLSDEKMDCNVDLLVLYAAVDCPASDTSSFHYPLPVDNLSHRYNIYPLISQMIDFNYYKSMFDIVDTEITIENITITFSEGTTVEINEDMLDEYVEKIFKKLKLITSVKDLELEHIILKGNKWYKSTSIPKQFDYILYNIKGNESMYLLSEKQFNRLCLIDELSIKMYGRYEYYLDFNTNDDKFEEEDNYINAVGINDILSSCLYFPQYIELEKSIYQSRMALKISLETFVKTFNLVITEKEFNENPIQLFNIINKLLQL